jgi:hypothetical protein
MSADNSPRSESNPNSRYSRATEQAQTPLPSQSKEPNEQRQREATRRQAEDDRRKRGQARKIDEVSALFGSPGAPEMSGDDAAAHGKTESDDSAGRGSTPPSDRPALELDEDEREEGEGQKKRKKQKSVVDFAAEHEIEPKAIYELAVPLEAGQEPVTVAALKDHYKATRDFETKRDEFEDWQQHAQGEVIQARSQLDDVVQRLTQVVPPDVLARAFTDMQADSAAALEKARGQLSEWFPEWSDVQVKIRDRTRLEEVLATYGFNKFEVGAVRDARLIKFAMDAIRKGDRYDRLKAGTREKIPSKEPTSQRKQRQPNATDQAREIAKKGDVVGGVVKLLGG